MALSEQYYGTMTFGGFWQKGSAYNYIPSQLLTTVIYKNAVYITIGYPDPEIPPDDLLNSNWLLYAAFVGSTAPRTIVRITRNYYQITGDQFRANTLFSIEAPNLTILMPDPTQIQNGYSITIKNQNFTGTNIISVTGLMDNSLEYPLMSPFISRNFMIYNGNFMLT